MFLHVAAAVGSGVTYERQADETRFLFGGSVGTCTAANCDETLRARRNPHQKQHFVTLNQPYSISPQEHELEPAGYQNDSRQWNTFLPCTARTGRKAMGKNRPHQL